MSNLKADPANIIQTLADEIRKLKLQINYTQGATNTVAYTGFDDAETNFPFNMKVYLPAAFLRINSAILDFKVQPYRALGPGSITENAMPAGSIIVNVGVDGNNLSEVGSVLVLTSGAGITNLNITNAIPTVGDWYNIQFVPGSNIRVRIEANLIVKTFSS